MHPVCPWIYEAGQEIGDYQIVERLGTGGMGAVYKVRNRITDRLEAMKVLLPDSQTTPDRMERFKREIRVHASLVHPHIVALRTAVQLPHQLLMIMELVEGESLAERLRHGALPVAESTRYVCQLLSALAYAHQRGVIHRDIKPTNIMVMHSRNVKLMDFGIATTHGALHSRLTAAGTALGSIHYMSPEQINAGTIDARTDLYCLGLTFFEMLTGQCPIQGRSEYEIMKAHLAVTPPSPTDLNASVPPALSAMVLKAIEKRPENRFQTAAAFLAALEPLAAGLTESRTRTPTAELPESHRGPAATGPLPFDPLLLETVTRELAFYIGPIARIIVSRAAKLALSKRQFYEAVAREIPAAADQTRFLARSWR
jgi:eukaryotic-like serine/threonine-protein kinase